MPTEIDVVQLVIELLAEIDEAAVVNDFAAWSATDGFEARREQAREAVRRGETVDAAEYSASSEDGQRERLAVVLGIDDAFGDISPLYAGGRPPEALLRFQERHADTGAYNEDFSAGRLLPRLTPPFDLEDLPHKLSDCLRHLVWIAPDHAVDLRFTTAPELSLMRANERRGLRVATAPMLRDWAELHCRVGSISDDAKVHYEIAVGDVSALADRVTAVVARLAKAEATLAVMPEMAFVDPLAEPWREEGAQQALDGGRLRWIFTGTGPESLGKKPYNRGVLLDAATGEELLSQRKQYRFDIKPDWAKDYPLPGWSKTETAHEFITADREGIEVMELGAARIAVLICEDLARLEHHLPQLVAAGVSLLLVPVLSKATEIHRWEHSAAKKYAEAAGTVIVVANSLAIGELTAPGEEKEAALLHGPVGFEVGLAEAPEQVLAFDVSVEGAVKAV